ncbi:MAG: dihydrodipicolinate synthase family protein [Planctomycetota bacterium]|jgi:4-hydroxy-tetrahydrodipicolinate synthase
MAKKIALTRSNIKGTWSAVSTPFTKDMKVDKKCFKRIIDHHVKLGCKGLFVCGTSGEGPWMTNDQQLEVINTYAKHAAGKLIISAQVTDNSPERILDNIKMAKSAGADIAVVAAPYAAVMPDDKRIADIYIESIRKSPLPVGFYDRGKNATVFISNNVLKKIYLEKNLLLVKDSSADTARRNIAIAARKKNKKLCLLNGLEFDIVSYAAAGYDGHLVGGGIFNSYMVSLIDEMTRKGDKAGALKLQDKMNNIMFKVFGGKKVKCWLTGQKQLCVEMGLFNTNASYLKMPLTDSCKKAIKQVVKREGKYLFPYK